jgi:predicted metal-binding protein
MKNAKAINKKYEANMKRIAGLTVNGNYMGADKCFNERTGKFEQPDVAIIIKKAAAFGFTPLLQKGMRIIKFQDCPDCGGSLLLSLVKRPDLRNRVRACKECGHRSMTPGMEKNHGNFVLVV